MERIQSAIAKARASREGRSPGGDEGVNPALAAAAAMAAGAQATHAAAPVQDAIPAAQKAPAQADNAGLRASWMALPALKTDLSLMRRNRIVAFEGGRQAVTYDVMRTRLLQQMRANNWRRVAITSPTAGCGKTTTSLNLAFSLARQSDLRVILAEVDLRRPTLARVLGHRGSQSFARVLAGESAFADNALRYGQNLAISTNSGPSRNPAELLHGPTVGPALAAIESVFEPAVTIFDMPPMMAGDDALAFIGHADCVLLVAAAESTTIEEVDTCERDLAAHTNVLGVVLNKCRFADPRYGYNYYA